MKVTVNILEYLLRYATPTGYVLAHADIDINDVFETNDIEAEQAFEIEDLLDRQKAIAVVWSAAELLERRPHLAEDQAWHVLTLCKCAYNGDRGLRWSDILDLADRLYPGPEATASNGE